MATPAMDTEFAQQSEAFLQWLRRNGNSISPKIKLADLRSRGAGRGVVATEDIAADEQLFSISRTSILTVETSGLPPELKNAIDDPWLSLITAMIYEYKSGLDSPWRPYFDILPVHFDTPMFWTKDELDALQGSAVLQKIGKQQADAAFGEKVVPLMRQHAGVFRAQGLSDNELLSLCHRMGSTMMAYAFDLERSPGAQAQAQAPEGEDGWELDDDENEALAKGMVPLADILNADADRNNAKLFYEDDSVVMRAIAGIAKGEEVFNDYGPLPTADVLRRYGYVTENYARYDVVEIPMDLIKEVFIGTSELTASDVERRLTYLEEHGVLDDGYDISHAPSDDQFPEDLRTLVNTLSLADPDFVALQKKGKLPKPEFSETALRLLSSIFLRRRAQYSPETIRDCRASLTHERARGQNRLAMARQVVLGEKKVLKEAAQVVDKELERLETQNVGNKRKRDWSDDGFEIEAIDLMPKRIRANENGTVPS